MSNNVLEHIARENFRSSGYLSHPKRERRASLISSKPPRSPFYSADAVRGALQRQNSKSTFIQTCLNAFLYR